MQYIYFTSISWWYFSLLLLKVSYHDVESLILNSKLPLQSKRPYVDIKLQKQTVMCDYQTKHIIT